MIYKHKLLSKTWNSIMHRHVFKRLSQNRDYVQTYCNDRNNPFHFACQTWIKNCT